MRGTAQIKRLTQACVITCLVSYSLPVVIDAAAAGKQAPPAAAKAKTCSQTGQAEPATNGGSKLVAGPTPGTETLVLSYTDEWPMDASDVRMSVNGQTWQNFADGSISGSPGNANPAKPNPANHGDYAVDPSNSSHWTRTLPPLPGLPVSTLSVSGSWTWGHAQDLNDSGVTNNPATVTYTFPIPSGSNVTIAVYLTDGDHCGDYLSASLTFPNVMAPVFRLAKSVSPTGTVTVGTRLAYTVTVTNTGRVAGSPGILDDNLGGVRSQVVSGPTPSAGTVTTVKSGQEWHWSVPSLAPGGSARLTMTIIPLSTGTEVNSAVVPGYTPVSVRTPVLAGPAGSGGVGGSDASVPVPATGAGGIQLPAALPIVGLILLAATARERRRNARRAPQRAS